MRRSTRVLLGVSVALITAASLHLTIGDRFHQRMRRDYGGYGCGHDSWRSHHQSRHKNQDQPQGSPNDNSDNQ